MMKEEDNKNLVIESREDTLNKPISKAQLMEKAIEEMNAKYGLKGIKGKPQSCTIMFVKNK